MRVVALRLLLAKDVRVLARSRAVLAALVLYPLALSLLVGTVLGGGTSRPVVAFVDEDHIPSVVSVGGASFPFGQVLAEATRRVELKRMSRERAEQALRDGEVVAAIIVPRGFIGQLSSLLSSPHVTLRTNRNAIEDRVEREVESFVYNLNRQIQQRFISANARFLDILVAGGRADVLGRSYDVLGLDATRRSIDGVLGQLPATSPQRAPLERVRSFAQQASTALGLAKAALGATAHPIELTKERISGRSYLLGSQVQSFGVAISLAFVGLLLGAGALTLEREENTLGRLVRGPARATLIVLEKLALCALAGVVLGFALVVGFGLAAIVQGGGDTPWGRMPLLVPSLAAAGAAFGALGALVGVAGRDLRSASLAGVAIATPIVLVGIVPKTVSPLADALSQLVPFAPTARAVGLTLFESDPAGVALAVVQLLALAAVFGALTRAFFGRLLS